MLVRSMLFVVDTHTEGEPTRIVVGGLPGVPGGTALEMREYIRRNLDWVRTTVIHEPRGHAGSFGAIVLPPARPGVDYTLVFMDSSGYLDMCGHGTMGVTTALIELGMVDAREPQTTVVYETPAGVVSARAEVVDGRVKSVTVRDVPSFYLGNLEVDVRGIGPVPVDIAFGGNFFAIVDGESLGVSVEPGNIKRLIELGLEVRDAANRVFPAAHPINPQIRGIKLTLISDKPKLVGAHARNVTIFADGAFDRSPCGTGTAAKMATLHAKGELRLGEEFVHESIIGTRFVGRLVEKTRVAEYEAVIPEISGRAYITSISHLVVDPDDPLRHGFIVR